MLLNEKQAQLLDNTVKTDLHIVCANAASHIYYGIGSLLYFELEALKEAGASIILHIFGEERVSESIIASCAIIHHYPIQSGHKAVSFYLPYSVAARQDAQLKENILSNKLPAMFYGWESTGVLEQAAPDKHRFWVRIAGIPHIQCKEYASFTQNIFRKFVYFNEALRARKYEKKLAAKASFLPFQQKDQAVLSNSLHLSSKLLPILLKPRLAECGTGLGNYCLYFGDFSDPEQEKSALWLMEEIFSHLPVPFVLAGRSPSRAIIRIARNQEHTALVIDPSEDELKDLIRKSQIQLFPLFSKTGIKSEIYHALLHGRHCLFYGDGYAPNILTDICPKVNNTEHAQTMIMELFNKPFNEEELIIRNKHFTEMNPSMDHAHQLLRDLH